MIRRRCCLDLKLEIYLLDLKPDFPLIRVISVYTFATA